MRLFRSSPGAPPVAALLRAMEHGRFMDAYRVLKRNVPDPAVRRPAPPPHALWRLGRWLADKGKPRRAALPLRLFLDLYPRHRDRPEVLSDLARAYQAGGHPARAAEAAREAVRLHEARRPKPGTEKVAR